MDARDLNELCGDCLLHGAIKGMVDGLVLVDRKERVFHLNRSASVMLGLNGANPVGASVRSLLSNVELAEFWVEARSTNGPVAAEIRFGRDRQIRATMSDCVGTNGRTLGKALVLRDVTREKKIHIELSTTVAERLIEITGGEPESTRLQPLTRREREVLRLLASGMSNADMASRMHVTVNTVATHLKHLYAKLGVTSRTGAVSYALRYGIRPVEDAHGFTLTERRTKKER